MPEEEKKEEDGEPESQSWFTKLLDSIGERIKDFVDSDDVKVYHPKYLFPMSVGIIVVLLGIFFALFVPTITESLRERFLAPIESSDKYCTVVANSNTGSFLATKGGDWVGSKNFTYSEATYSLTLANYIATEEQYAKEVSLVRDRLDSEGNKSSNYDLGRILLYWMSYTDKTSSARFNLHADPAYIFEREKITSAIASVNGSCAPDSLETSYSPTSARALLSVDYADLLADPMCDIMNARRFGYLPEYEGNSFQISLDIRSVVTAQAMNLGILNFDLVVKVSNTETTVQYNLTETDTREIPVASFYDPSYPDMDPITCTTQNYTYAPYICFVRMGSTAALPVFNHVGKSESEPIPCDCSELTEEELSDSRHPCHTFNFMSGVLYYNTSLGLGGILQLALNYTAEQIVTNSLAPMYLGSGWGDTSIYSPAFLRNAYQWCYNSRFGYCSYVVFTHWDQVVFDYSVNEYLYQLRYGACRNTLSTSKDNWQKLIDTPFSPLTQDYVICRRSLSNAVINSVGVTSGNISLLYPFVVLLFLLLVAFYQKCSGTVWPKGYHQNDKDEILDNFATMLLLLRDQKLHANSSDKNQLKQLQIARLAKELHALSNQLAKQYETPEQHSKRTRSCWHRLYSKMRTKQRPEQPEEKEDAVDVEEGSVGAEAVVEEHYGRYQLVGAKALSVRNFGTSV